MLYYSTFFKLNVPETAIQSYTEPLLGFVGRRVHARGFVNLLTTFGVGKAYRTITVRYILVDADTSYNILIRCCTLNQLGTVVSTPRMAMKFPASNGDIITVKADPKEARQCYMQSLKISPYSVKTREEQATQTEELEAPLAKCNHVELTARLAEAGGVSGWMRE